MLLDQMHREDVKAAIRKRYGTVADFQTAKDLPATGVADLLRGRASRRVREAVEAVIRDSMELDSSGTGTGAHRLIGGAK